MLIISTLKKAPLKEGDIMFFFHCKIHSITKKMTHQEEFVRLQLNFLCKDI